LPAHRILIALAACATLAGCARFEERSHGSWLDTYGMPPPATRQMVAEPQATQLRTQIAQIEAQAEAIRVKLALEKDRIKRYAYLRQLRDLDDQQRPLDELLHLGPQRPFVPLLEPGNAGA
jgi:ABC-type uncharacterized transport system auxiliary subunit